MRAVFGRKGMCHQAGKAASQTAQCELVASSKPGYRLLNVLSTETQGKDPLGQQGRPEPPPMTVSWKWSPSLACSFEMSG